MKKKRDVERLNPEVAGVPESRGPSQGLLKEKCKVRRVKKRVKCKERIDIVEPMVRETGRWVQERMVAPTSQGMGE